jgi:hypothetical protein
MCWFEYSNHGCMFLGNDVEWYDLCRSRSLHLLGDPLVGRGVFRKCKCHDTERPTNDYHQHRSRVYRLRTILLHEWHLGRADKRFLHGFIYHHMD